jgi:DNA-binding transcriptional MerR regulator
MLKIGEFARLSQVSLKTLRHYDTMGILHPSQIDAENGYRLYELAQLADMMRIQALKDCGFALEEIAHLMQTHDTKAIEELLNQRVAAQQQVVAEEQARLQRLLARVKQLSTAEHIRPYDVVLKRTEPLTLVGLRECVAGTEQIGPLAWKVLGCLEQHKLALVGPLIHLYYDESGFDEGIDLFVGAAVAALPDVTDGLCCERLSEGQQVACVLYRGDYQDIRNGYIALNFWLSTSGYQRVGPCREIYLRSPVDTADSASYLTELQIPIEKA